jgi:hypothetical protein
MSLVAVELSFLASLSDSIVFHSQGQEVHMDQPESHYAALVMPELFYHIRIPNNPMCNWVC